MMLNPENENKDSLVFAINTQIISNEVETLVIKEGAVWRIANHWFFVLMGDIDINYRVAPEKIIDSGIQAAFLDATRSFFITNDYHLLGRGFIFPPDETELIDSIMLQEGYEFNILNLMPEFIIDPPMIKIMGNVAQFHPAWLRHYAITKDGNIWEWGYTWIDANRHDLGTVRVSPFIIDFR